MQKEFTTLAPEGSENARAKRNGKRPPVRPKIHYMRAALCAAAALGCAAVTGAACGQAWRASGLQAKINLSAQAFGILCAAAVLTAFLIAARKKIFIFLIRLYQRFAPEKVRNRCVFTPCCSEYMIMAVEKYGLLRGVRKGLNRLKRCKEPDGGEDYP